VTGWSTPSGPAANRSDAAAVWRGSGDSRARFVEPMFYHQGGARGVRDVMTPASQGEASWRTLAQTAGVRGQRMPVRARTSASVRGAWLNGGETTAGSRTPAVFNHLLTSSNHHLRALAQWGDVLLGLASLSSKGVTSWLRPCPHPGYPRMIGPTPRATPGGAYRRSSFILWFGGAGRLACRPALPAPARQ
jgi:hypothetical protein